MTTFGYQGTDVSAPLGSLACQLRDACHAVLKEWSYINKIGVAGLQAAPYNMTQADAQSMFNYYSYLQTIAGVYYGTATQATSFNFDDALALVRGGQ